MHGRSVATCFNLALFKFRQLVSEELEFVVVTHDHLIQSMEDAMKLMRAGGMLMTKHVSLPLQPHQVRFGTAPPPPHTLRMCHAWLQAARSAPVLAHVPHVASGRTLRPPAWRMCHAWLRTARFGPLAWRLCHAWLHTAPSAPLPGACTTRGLTSHAHPPAHSTTRGCTPHTPRPALPQP